MKIIGILSLIILSFNFVACQENKKDAINTQRIDKKRQEKPQEIPIWNKKIPDFELIKGTETYTDGMIKNVSKPTMTVFPPKVKNTGVAVIVYPGGGYTKLAINLEGSEICQWLASKGITGILLKYRVPASGPYENKACNCEKDPEKPLALQDAQRTLGLVRARAKELN